jgi:pyruvate dehydrogenase E2 component (dihydrolipoamide acetyltransferase)
MAKIITMPRLSDTMTDGTVATWLKKVGDKVQTGEMLAEIETDKATMEFESFQDGYLLYIGVQEGETAPVDSLLAIIGNKGEDISKMISPPTPDGGVSDTPKVVENTETKSPSLGGVEEALLPAGVKIITMPRLSDTMTEGTVATWLKKVGDTIKEGDMMAEIETDKATMEFESFNAGTLLYIGIKEGESAPVDSVLAIIGPAGTDVSGLISPSNSGGESLELAKETIKIEEISTKSNTSSEVVQNKAVSDSRIFASPLARKIAKEKGIALNTISGSGENGRITKKDVENYQPSTSNQQPVINIQPISSNQQPITNSQPQIFVPAGETYSEAVKNSQMRKVIAKRLAESKFTAPHYYLTIEMDMDQAIASRNTINTIPNTKVSFNDMVIKAVAMALKKHPKVNSQWKEEETIINHHVNVGVAVAVEDGLVVPVLKFTDQMTLTQIGENVKDMATRAKAKKIQPSEMEGSTFTVSNLGMFGIQSFTSIINQPNSAILSIGTIVEKPVVKNGAIVVGNTMTVTLACDHRTVDGATGAQFLQTFKSYMENPVTMLA